MQPPSFHKRVVKLETQEKWSTAEVESRSKAIGEETTQLEVDTCKGRKCGASKKNGKAIGEKTTQLAADAWKMYEKVKLQCLET